MGNNRTEVAILGGGLSGCLIALALARYKPNLSVLLVEEGPALGGNHVWSFFESDLGRAGHKLVAPLIEHSWPDYDVRFPGHARTLRTAYHMMTSARLDAVTRAALPANAILCGRRAIACSATAVTLADGDRIEADAVIDARGAASVAGLSGGWQKFLGRRLKLTAPHRLARPMVMDASVDQIDGYRFVYCLPLAADEVFVEDTYYSDGPALGTATLAARVDAYCRARGWEVAEVLGEETGVLPVVADGDFARFWRESGGPVARAGARGGLFHPLTSYSLPDAVRYALGVAERLPGDGAKLAEWSKAASQHHWERGGFYRLLVSFLFATGVPHERYRVLERFYRLDAGLIERFYAGRSTLADKARVLIGKPPVPFMEAVGVLGGWRAGPPPLAAPAKPQRAGQP